MTSEAPERIWAWKTENCNGPWAIAEGEGVEYIRRDLSLAAVAEAYEDASEFARDTADQEQAEDGVVWADLAQMVDAIESRTPADALAAREARDKQVREDALRKAAVTVSCECQCGPITLEKKILALIEGDTDE